MPGPLGAFVGAFQFLSSIQSPGRRYDVRISDAGAVTVTARISNARSPGMRVARELAANASQELTAFLAGGPPPSTRVVSQFTREQIDMLDAWIATHPIVGDDAPLEPSPPGGTAPPKRWRPIPPPPGKEPVGLPPEHEGEEDGDAFSVVGGEQVTPVGAEDFFMPRFVRGLHKSIPGGAAGMAQQTPATITRVGRALGARVTGGRRARRSRSNGATRPRRRRAASRSRRGARLVKGSAAAKRHMAKLRRMRKR